MPFLILFLSSWTAFILFADRKRWRIYAPVSLLAMVMSLTSDHFVSSYPLWSYRDTSDVVPESIIRVLDDFGVYPVTTYLFIQYKPRLGGVRRVLYYLAWTSGVILLEKFFCLQGWMVHNLWWNLGCSYLADWLIFLLLASFAGALQGVNKMPVEAPKPKPDLLEIFKQYGVKLDFLSEKQEADVLLLELQPGSKIGPHTHSGDEFVVVLQGQLELTMESERQVYTAGECMRIRRHVVHSAVNKDSREVALLLSIVLSSGLQQKLRAHTLDQILLSNEPLRL